MFYNELFRTLSKIVPKTNRLYNLVNIYKFHNTLKEMVRMIQQALMRST